MIPRNVQPNLTSNVDTFTPNVSHMKPDFTSHFCPSYTPHGATIPGEIVHLSSHQSWDSCDETSWYKSPHLLALCHPHSVYSLVSSFPPLPPHPTCWCHLLLLLSPILPPLHMPVWNDFLLTLSLYHWICSCFFCKNHCKILLRLKYRQFC